MQRRALSRSDWGPVSMKGRDGSSARGEAALKPLITRASSKSAWAIAQGGDAVQVQLLPAGHAALVVLVRAGDHAGGPGPAWPGPCRPCSGPGRHRMAEPGDTEHAAAEADADRHVVGGARREGPPRGLNAQRRPSPIVLDPVRARMLPDGDCCAERWSGSSRRASRGRPGAGYRDRRWPRRRPRRRRPEGVAQGGDHGFVVGQQFP